MSHFFIIGIISGTCLVVVGLGCVWLLVVRQARAREHALILQTQVQEQLKDAAQAQLNMTLALNEARHDFREQAERTQAAQARLHVEQVQGLQRQLAEVMGLTQTSLEASRKTTDMGLLGLSSTLQKELVGQKDLMARVQSQLGALSEAARSMQVLGQDIASLQDILQAPKLRGNLGELLLSESLRQVLPADSYALQHRLSAQDGGHVVVDAAIRLGERWVPIDSKFPLESFKRLLAQNNGADGTPDAPSLGHKSDKKLRRAFLDVVKGHIDVVADKYIRPDLHTYDFALAYLPAENVYYEAVVRHDAADGLKSVSQYAAERHVILVSPSTLYAYLMTLAFGLKGLRIEAKAEAIRGQLAAWNKGFNAFAHTFDKLGRHLDLAQRDYHELHKRHGPLMAQVNRIVGAADKLEAQKEETAADAQPGDVIEPGAIKDAQTVADGAEMRMS